MPENNSENLLREGQELREGGQTLKALAELNAAMAEFIAEGNFGRYAHALLDRCICWQHFYQQNGDPVFVILYKKDAEAMLEIVEAKNIVSELAQAYFINGKAGMLEKDYARAVEFFQKAIDGIAVDRPAQKGDWMTNLGKAMYLTGQKADGQKEMLEGIKQIEKFAGEMDQYTVNVWKSGGYLRLAEVLKADDANASAQYLSEAQKIIENDPGQIVRKQNLEKFIATGETDL